jgi:hypothetical protein
LTKVELGRNLGNQVEILSGISPEASLIDNPPESFTNGLSVRVAGSGDGDKNSKEQVSSDLSQRKADKKVTEAD